MIMMSICNIEDTIIVIMIPLIVTLAIALMIS